MGIDESVSRILETDGGKGVVFLGAAALMANLAPKTYDLAFHVYRTIENDTVGFFSMYPIALATTGMAVGVVATGFLGLRCFAREYRSLERIKYF
jgi:hypothetical protein